MTSPTKNLQSRKKLLLDTWMKYQLQNESLREDLITNEDLKIQSDELLSGMIEILKKDSSYGTAGFDDGHFDKIKEVLAGISISRAQKGFSPRETGMFVLSLKEAFLTILEKEYKDDKAGYYEQLMRINRLVDQMSLFSFETYLKGREEVILRQREEISEISTPVIRLWDGILALPIIGTLDSARTQVVMENLLTELVNTGSSIAILDISGVPAVDSLVAQHLIKTVSATRLMGGECIISGIRPEIAQTIVHLGIDLTDITTKATLASALKHALKILNVRFVKTGS